MADEHSGSAGTELIPYQMELFPYHLDFHIQYNGMLVMHGHSQFCEFIFVLSGKIEHCLNGETTVLDRNTLVFLTEKDFHSLKKLTDDSYYGCLSIETEHFKELMQWIAPGFFDRFMQGPFRIEVPSQEAGEISNMINDIMTTFDTDYYVFAHLLAMLFVKQFAAQFENTQKGAGYHPAVAKFIQYVNIPANLALSLDEILAAISYSYPHINRLFKSEMGCSVGKYLQNQKMNYAKKLLTFTDKPLSEISEMLGFSGYAHFSLSFKNAEGVSPSQYRNRKLQQDA